MKDKIHDVLDLFDLPGGVILGMYSLVILGMCVAAFYLQREIPASVKEIYNWLLTAFAVSKTVRTIWGKPVDQAPEGNK